MSKLFDKALALVSEDVKRFVDHSINISDQIHAILSEKGISQRRFAELLGKKESEVSKWLTGTHNFTLKSIGKIEAVLNEKIIVTPQQAKHSFQTVKFVNVTTYVTKPTVTANVNNPLSTPGNTEMVEASIETRDSKIFDNGLKSA